LVVHPLYVFGTLEPTFYEAYKQCNHLRALSSYKAMSDVMIKNSLVKIKEHPPYVGDMERKVLLNSMARATFDPKTGKFSFKDKLPAEVPLDVANAKAFSAIATTNGLTDGNSVGVGVDQIADSFG
jgi:fatty acid synthase subunit alpha, fungi type